MRLFSSIQLDFLPLEINHLKNQVVISETSAAYRETTKVQTSLLLAVRKCGDFKFHL